MYFLKSLIYFAFTQLLIRIVFYARKLISEREMISQNSRTNRLHIRGADMIEAWRYLLNFKSDQDFYGP